MDSEQIKIMFDKIASKYDFMNNIISFGLHKWVKKTCANKIKQGETAIDICCGTGDITRLLSQRQNIENVVGVDFSQAMLDIANKKNKNSKITYQQADCTNLPFANNAFDICTISFGFRNIQDKEKALNEISRILKTDATFMYLDFSKSESIIDKFFDILLPIFGKLSYSKSYKYLADSKQKYLTDEELKSLFEKHNLKIQKKYKYIFNAITMFLCSKEK